MRRVIVYGATSAIASETIRLLAEEGASLFLIGRSQPRLDAVAADAKVRGALQVVTCAVDLDDFAGHEDVWRSATQALGQPDVVLVAHGVLGDQGRAQADWREAERVMRTNFLSVASLLTPVANDLAAQRHGVIIVISSVAGDRGRQSNYVYGASKGALNVFLAGLRNRLCPAGVRVVTVKPGFVATPMTAHLRRGPLFADPKDVAAGIRRAIDGGPDVVYLPGWWRPIMSLIEAIPEPVFKRLRL